MDKCYQYLSQSAELGNANAQFNLSYFYENGIGCKRDPLKATEWLTKSADEGFDLAQHKLGTQFIEDKRTEEGLELMTKSHSGPRITYNLEALANEGIAASQFELCLFLLQGVGNAATDKTAFDYCKKSAEQGYDEAQHLLGTMYHKGIGCERDLEKAIEWNQIGADKGDAACQYYLGYFDKKDYSNALKWLQKSANQKYAEALRFISYAHFMLEQLKK